MVNSVYSPDITFSFSFTPDIVIVFIKEIDFQFTHLFFTRDEGDRTFKLGVIGVGFLTLCTIFVIRVIGIFGIFNTCIYTKTDVIVFVKVTIPQAFLDTGQRG